MEITGYDNIEYIKKKILDWTHAKKAVFKHLTVSCLMRMKDLDFQIGDGMFTNLGQAIPAASRRLLSCTDHGDVFLMDSILETLTRRLIRLKFKYFDLTEKAIDVLLEEILDWHALIRSLNGALENISTLQLPDWIKLYFDKFQRNQAIVASNLQQADIIVVDDEE
jgi:hypothetical protein